MPSLKYLDPASQTYKYVVGGMSQDSADARYLLSGRRNVIRNGDISVAQRGNGFFSGSGSYGADGWQLFFAGGSIEHSRDVSSPLDAFLKLSVSGQSGSNYARFVQYIEDVTVLHNTWVTVSFDAYAASGTPLVGVSMEQRFGTGGSPTSVQAYEFGAVQISTTRKRYSVSGFLPSVEGRSFGTDMNHKLTILLHASGTSNGIGLQSNTWYFTDVQVEQGQVATPFERLSQQEQLAWCQRYFQRWNNPPLKGGARNTTRATPIGMAIPTMRVAPTLSISGYSWQVINGLYLAAVSAIDVSPANYLTADQVNMDVTYAAQANYAMGHSIYVWPGTAVFYIDLSAEL